MDIQFICEHCGKELTVQDYLAGQRIECYHCHRPVVVPAEGEKAIIEFQCLGCGTQFRVPSSRAGTRSKCPRCEAVLVVPGRPIGTPPAPLPVQETHYVEPVEQIYEEQLPPPPPTAVRRGAPAGAPAPARPQGPQAPSADLSFVTPPKSGVSAGLIIVLVAVAFFGVIGLAVLLSGNGKGDGGFASLEPAPQVQYDPALGNFTITNRSHQTWIDAVFIIESGGVSYTYRVDMLRPGPLTVHADRFVTREGVAFNSLSMTGERVIILATPPDGRRGRFILNWTGRPATSTP